MSETDIDKTEVEDLPSTDIMVSLHVHYGMAGSFPLRLADLFFADDGLHIAEYGHITPLFGLGMRKHQREANGMQAIYDYHGLDEVLLQADSVTWLAYGTIKQVVIHDGGQFGRPKLTVYTDNHSYAYRLHNEESRKGFADDIEVYANQHGFTVKTVSGVGFSPVENIRRFLS
jgi:hypothetical protein